jgi:hypothetical protein
MTDLSRAIAHGFERDYERLRLRVHELATPLSDAAFWTKPFLYGNSFGHLVLHVTGNLNYYIGAQIARTGYLRDRPREFTDTDRPSKSAVLAKFDEAVRMVERTAEAQTSDADWLAQYEGVGEPDAHNRFDIFLKCAMHFYHHVGQMIYLSREGSA